MNVDERDGIDHIALTANTFWQLSQARNKSELRDSVSDGATIVNKALVEFDDAQRTDANVTSLQVLFFHKEKEVFMIPKWLT